MDDIGQRIVFPQPYDLTRDRLTVALLVAPPLLLLALLLATDWIMALAWPFPFGIFVAIGVINWLRLREGRDATWEFDDLGASLWWPGKRVEIPWSNVQAVDVTSSGPRGQYPVIRIAVATAGPLPQSAVYRIRTLSAPPDAIAYLIAQIEAHVSPDLVSARFAEWAGAVHQRQQAIRTTQVQ